MNRRTTGAVLVVVATMVYVHVSIIESQKRMMDSLLKLKKSVDAVEVENGKSFGSIRSAIDSGIKRLAQVSFEESSRLCTLAVDVRKEMKKNILEGAVPVGVDPSADGKLVEQDYRKQKLLTEGKNLYGRGAFGKSASVYRKVIALDPAATNAIIYYSASLYYQNPGDESTYHTAKKNLVPLLETKDLPAGEKRIILDVLAGISREEGDTASLGRYQRMQKQMAGGSR